MNRSIVWLIFAAFIVGCGDDAAQSTCRDDGSCAPGDECAADDDCVSGACEDVCLEPCSDEQDCGEAAGCQIVRPQVTACRPHTAALGDFGDPCTDGGACRTGVCDAGVCTELCTTECVLGAACTPTSIEGTDVGVCQWLGGRPLMSFGPFEVSTAGTDPIPIELPPGLASVSFIVRDAEPGSEARVGIGSLTTPDGTVLDDGDLDYSDPNPAAIRYPDATTIAVPIADLAGPPAPGRYTLTARRFTIDFEAADPFVPTEGSVFVDVVPEWEGEEGGLLDLNVFVAPAIGVAPRIDDDYLAAMLDVVEAKFSPAGVALGNVTPISLAAEYDVVSDSTTARQMCRQVSQPGQYASAVNVFLVDQLEFAYGFTGGSPSPPGLFGHAPSGVVVDAGGDPTQTGVVVAHEIGHFLGLSHTTAFNSDGSVFGTDPVSDTPECDSDSQSCADHPNLMYPRIDFDQPNELSAGQLAVISRNPVLYEFVRPDRCEQWPARDITNTRRAAGILPASGTAEGSCGGAGGEIAHLLRASTAGTYTFRASGAIQELYVRSNGCEEAEVACAAQAELTVELSPGDHFVFVDGTGPYKLEVTGP